MNVLNKLLFIIILFTTSTIYAQTINWSGVVKHDNGEPMENADVTLKFSILENDTENLVYSETHSTQTNSTGFVNAEIGNGTPTQGTFSSIDWSEKYKLKAELDAGNGNIVLGTSEMKSVPYANSAITSKELKKGNTGISIEDNNLKIALTVNGNETGSFWGDGGKLQLDYLGGSGNGELYVDAQGTIERKSPVTKTKFLSISGAALAGDNDDFHPQYGVYSTITGFNRMHAPVYFPDNAVITNMKVVYFDNSTAEISISLLSHTDTSQTGTLVAGINTTNAAQWQIINAVATGGLVNNQEKSYTLSVHCNNWEGNYEKAGIRRIVITYEVTE